LIKNGIGVVGSGWLNLATYWSAGSTEGWDYFAIELDQRTIVIGIKEHKEPTDSTGRIFHK
jgi:predicted secreted hydrolase